MKELKYEIYTPATKGYSNGMISFAAHPKTRRKAPCYIPNKCHDKEPLGWRTDCWSGYHVWLLNFRYEGFYGQGLSHYHCLYCGIARDFYEREILGTRGPKVSRDWIEKVEMEGFNPV